MSREHVIRALVAAAYDAMLEECRKHQNVSAGEVFSANLTMAQRAVITARDGGGDLSELRRGVELIWLELPQERVS